MMILSISELEPSFPYKDVSIRRNFDMKQHYDLEGEIGRYKNYIFAVIDLSKPNAIETVLISL